MHRVQQCLTYTAGFSKHRFHGVTQFYHRLCVSPTGDTIDKRQFQTSQNDRGINDGFVVDFKTAIGRLNRLSI